jgi:hypothetical protein
MKQLLTAECLRAVLDYDPETGIFTFKVRLSRRVRVGQQTSKTRDSGGYLGVGIDGRRYRLHRLAWLYVHGVWPTHEGDHWNGIKTDNRIDNLRDATRAVNSQNTRRAASHNKSGLQGVWSPGPRSKKFSSYIIANGIRRRLGSFDTAEAAHAAHIAAKRQLHKGCTI